MKFIIYMLLCTSFSLALRAQENIVDRSTGASFPAHVSFEANGQHYDLQATGVATRKKLIFKVYSVANYLQKGANLKQDPIQEILSDNYAKQLTMKWARDVGADKVQNGFQESFHKVFPDEKSDKLDNTINQFIQFFNRDALKGDEYVLRWIPGGIIEVFINGNKVGSLQNKEFAQGLWSIWFGPKSVVNRDELLKFLS